MFTKLNICKIKRQFFNFEIVYIITEVQNIYILKVNILKVHTDSLIGRKLWQ